MNRIYPLLRASSLNWCSIFVVNNNMVSVKYSTLLGRINSGPFTVTGPIYYSKFDNDSISALKIPIRFSTVFTSVPGEQLWEGVVGAKGSTKKRARGKRRVKRPKIDLHAGQRIGVGKAAMIWPGLNAPMIRRQNIATIEKGDFNEAYFKRLDLLRSKSAVKRKRMKLPPLSRGWSGSRLGGQSLGPPAPNYPEFDTRILEVKTVATMTASAGRYRRYSVLVVTGNGRGLCGTGKAKALTMGAAITRAKVRSLENLVSFEIKENRTLWHIGYVSEWNSKIFALPSPEGSGLTCHRLIRTLCQVIGIKDMYAKVEGNTKNYQVITRGFLRLLSEQESYQDLANRVGLHVVEFTADRDMYPRVLSSPACGHTVDPAKLEAASGYGEKSSIQTDNSDEPTILAVSHPERHRPRKPKPEEHESFLDDLVEIGEGKTVETDFIQLLASGERDIDALTLGGRVPLIKRGLGPGYWKNPGNLKKVAIRHRFRNHEAVKREREVYTSLTHLSI